MAASGREHLTSEVIFSEENFILWNECEDLRSQDFPPEDIEDLFYS